MTDLAPGTRVRLHAPSPVLTLTLDTGTIVRADECECCYIVRLDEPALCDNGVAAPYELHEVLEAEDNLTVLP